MFCLIVGFISGTSKLEINCIGNLNKLKESDGNLLAVRDELEDATFWTVVDDLVVDDFGTEDGDFVTTDGDFVTTDGDFGTTDGDFETEGGDFVTENGGSLKIKGDIGSDSGWGNGLNEIHRYFLGCVMTCITCK